jgi:ubiquitin-activating enzyme E1
VLLTLPLSIAFVSNNIAFISADIRGLFANVFCDFGPEFTVFDTNGEAPISCLLSSVSQETSGVITVSDDSRHGLETGDFVTFSNVRGMVELNSIDPVQITVHTFSRCSISCEHNIS